MSETKSLAFAFAAGAAVGSIALAYFTASKKEDAGLKAEKHLTKIVEYSFTGGLIRIGDELKLYDTLWESGPSTAAELAQKMDCSERWLMEILSQATAAGICVYFFGKFCLKPEYAHLLRDPNKSKRSMQGIFQVIPSLLMRTEGIVNAVKTGIGFDYDFGQDVTSAIDRKNYNWFQNNMLDDVLCRVIAPRTSRSLVDMLEEGITVADIGCGFGSSTVAMAKRFPNSKFYAYEASQRSILKMQERFEEEKLDNVTAYNAANRSIGEGPPGGNGKFDFVYAHDVVHDMTQPRQALKEIKKVLSPDGVLVIIDVKCSDSLKDNIGREDAALLFGYSCLLCLPCGCSSKSGDGAALGTCGFPEKLARKWSKEDGFEFFQTMEIESLPANSCYIVA